MKIRLSFLVPALLASVVLWAQNAPQPLPSAPSSVQYPKPAPAPVPAPKEQSPKPETTTPAPAPAQVAARPAPPAEAASSNAGDPAPDDPNVTTFRTRVNEVSLIFTVTDKHGRFVKDLKKSDFRVLDDNKPPAEIKDFRSETNLPLRVGLMIDASNSVRERFKFEQEAAIEFLNQIIRPRTDRAFIIGFDTTAEVTQDFTDSTALLSKGIRMLRPGGGTALFDALYTACRDKLMSADQGGVPVRRAVILLSDGNDNQSRATREEAIEMAQRAEVIVYTISTNVSGVKEKGDKVLERIAEATGGRYFAPFKIEDVANAFSEIQEELRSQYALAYKPADFKFDGRFRAIEIAADRKGLQVRARKGYYAPKQ